MKPALRQHIRTVPVWLFLLDFAVFFVGIGVGDYLLPHHRTAGMITLGVTVGILILLLFAEWIREHHQLVWTYLKTRSVPVRGKKIPVWVFVLWILVLLAAGITGECLLPTHETAGHVLLSAVGVFLLFFLIILGIAYHYHKRHDGPHSPSERNE